MFVLIYIKRHNITIKNEIMVLKNGTEFSYNNYIFLTCFFLTL